MPPSLRKAVAAAIGGGAIAIASVLITVDWPPESPDNQYHLNK
jgi:hypothetical protein